MYRASSGSSESREYHIPVRNQALFVTLVALLVYSRALGNGFVQWDDGLLVLRNDLIQTLNLETLKGIFTSYDPELYIPLTFLTYQIETALFGMNPLVFHLTNVLLHAANSVLVFLLLRRLLGPTQRGQELSSPLTTLKFLTPALLFAVHPLNAEAVVWVSARKDLLATLFSLLTILLYLRGNSLWALLTFTLALLSKISAVTVPLLLVFIEWSHRKGQDPSTPHAPPGVLTLSTLKVLTPFFILSILFSLIALQGKSYLVPTLSLFDRLLLWSGSVLFYVKQSILPLHFSLFYEWRGPDPTHSPMLILAAIIVFGSIVLMLRMRHRFRLLAFGWGWYIAALLPTVLAFAERSIPNQAEATYIFYASDRFAYFPSIGLFLAITALVLILVRRRLLLMTLVTSILFALSLRTWDRVGDWKSSTTLYESDVEAEHPSFIPYANLGAIRLQEGRHEEAIALLEHALSLHPNLAKTHATLGEAYGEIGEYEKGVMHLLRATELEKR